MNSLNHLKSRLFLIGLWLVCSMTSLPALSAGLLTPANSPLPALDIKDHKVSVIIEDGYAITTVNQVFHNPHTHDLEAIYSFPVPAHAAVAEFTMWIDGKPVTGEVLEKQQARQVYEEEKAAGRDVGLTEKDSYKTFDIHVSPVRAGQETQTRLVYLQPAHMDTGIGRYVYPLEDGGVDEQKLAFWTRNENVSKQFSFDLTVKSGYPVDAVRVPNHPQAQITQQQNGEWKVHIGTSAPAVNATRTDDVPTPAIPPQAGILRPTDTIESPEAPTQAIPALTTTSPAVYTLDKDLVVYWRHQPGLPGSVDMVTYKPEASKRGTFMLSITPGDDLKPIQHGSDWVFVLDVSGSMRGKFATLAEGVGRALKKMQPNDRFRIVLFNNSAREMTSGYIPASPENIQRYIDALHAVTPDRGTNLYQGLVTGIHALNADRTSAIVLVTDGVANVGETQQRRFLKLVDQKDVRLFTFIMGNSANRPMLESLTDASNGFAISISNSDDIVGQLLKAASKVTHEAMHDVDIRITGVKTADMSPKQIGSVYRGQQLVLFGHYWGEGKAKLTLTGKVSGQPVKYETGFIFPASSHLNPEIERLWAYANIEQMTDEINNFGEKADTKQAITDLGIEYGLVTDYTSMVVMQDSTFTERGIHRTNKRRLEIEHKAQQQRAQQAAQTRRVDTQNPMYSSNRPSLGSGSGSIGPVFILLVIMLLASAARTRRTAANA